MKKYENRSIYLFFLGMMMISFIFGYKIIGGKLQEIPDDRARINNEDLDIIDYPDLEILKEYEDISPNALMEERIHYSTCGHVITKVNSVDEKLVNMSKEELKTYIEENSPNKRLISYSPNKITLGVVKNHLCEKHFIIGEKDGRIAIFKIGENGERVLDKIFLDYPISLLMDLDQEKIIEGITVDSEEELSEVLENFIS